MGEAKRRRAAREAALDALERCDIDRVASGIRKYCLAASPTSGTDCYAYAVYGQWLLARVGVSSEIAVGYAAWRVGNGDHDVIAHEPSCSIVSVPSNDGGLYHAWLEVAGRILDFTTHLLPSKGAAMDAIDGRKTTVLWHPDYLFADKAQISSMASVRQDHAGLFYYERVRALELRAKVEAIPAPEADLQDLWFVYQHPEAIVSGPNTVMQLAGL